MRKSKLPVILYIFALSMAQKKIQSCVIMPLAQRAGMSDFWTGGACCMAMALYAYITYHGFALGRREQRWKALFRRGSILWAMLGFWAVSFGILAVMIWRTMEDPIDAAFLLAALLTLSLAGIWTAAVHMTEIDGPDEARG